MTKAFVRAMAACEPHHSGETLVGRMLAATRPAEAVADDEPWPRPDGYTAVVDGGMPYDDIRARVGRRWRGGAQRRRGGRDAADGR